MKKKFPFSVEAHASFKAEQRAAPPKQIESNREGLAEENALRPQLLRELDSLDERLAALEVQSEQFSLDDNLRQLAGMQPADISLALSFLRGELPAIIHSALNCNIHPDKNFDSVMVLAAVTAVLVEKGVLYAGAATTCIHQLQQEQREFEP